MLVLTESVIGQRYGMLTVVEIAPPIKRYKMVTCVCDCGSRITVRLSRIRSRAEITDKIGCGCLAGKWKKHGDSNSRLYRIWDHMIRRCHSVSNHAFSSYGGRGIVVCPEWHDYLAFREWAKASGYQDFLSIDRINNDDGYYPANCRWATAKEQQNNKSCNHYIEYDGRKQTLTQWSEELGMSRKRALAFLTCLK
jgi:hypothetical protein